MVTEDYSSSSSGHVSLPRGTHVEILDSSPSSSSTNGSSAPPEVYLVRTLSGEPGTNSQQTITEGFIPASVLRPVSNLKVSTSGGTCAAQSGENEGECSAFGVPLFGSWVSTLIPGWDGLKFQFQLFLRANALQSGHFQCLQRGACLHRQVFFFECVRLFSFLALRFTPLDCNTHFSLEKCGAKVRVKLEGREMHCSMESHGHVLTVLLIETARLWVVPVSYQHILQWKIELASTFRGLVVGIKFRPR